MKKLFALLLVLLMVFVLAACGASTDEPSDKDNPAASHSDKNSENKEIEAYSMEAAERYIKSLNLDVNQIAPDFQYQVKDKHAYGEDPENWNAQAMILFTKDGAEVTDDEYDAWLRKVFAATAAASDDGYNVVGNSTTDNDTASTTQTTLEDAINQLVPHWGFRVGEQVYIVYVSKEYSDTDKESEIGNLFYYDGVMLHISDL